MIKATFMVFLGCLFIMPNLSSYGLDGVVSDGNLMIDGAESANWTVMYYLCGENHVSYVAKEMLDNLTKVGSSNDFNLIVLRDGNQQGDSALYYIEEGRTVNLNTLYSWPNELDMGDPNTLKAFLNLVMEDYPAKHYALMILSDCGSGWQGICRDAGARNNGIPLMTMPTFADVLKDVTNDGEKKIDVIGFMPCVTGMFEVAYELAPYVDYMVASEEHLLERLDNGQEYVWRYLEPTWDLKNHTDMKAEEFASSIVDYYRPCDFPLWVFYGYMVIVKKGEYGRPVEFLSNILTRTLNSLPNPEWHIVATHTTLSAVNLSKVDQVARAIDNLSSLLLLNKYSSDVRNSIINARSEVREYGKSYVKDRSTVIQYINFPIEKLAFDSFVDLYDLVQLLNESVENQAVKNACKDVMLKLNIAVIANKAMPNDDSHGLSIYFPENKDLYNRYLWSDELPSPYENLRFSKDTRWDEFLKEYLGI